MKSIWAKGESRTKNFAVCFVRSWTPEPGETLKIAATPAYRLFLNGEFKHYGPARAAHHFVRTDEFDLSAYAGRPLAAAVEIIGANVNTYCYADQPPAFGAEVCRGGKVLFDAAAFSCRALTDHVTRTERYSFQRPFAEAYRMAGDRRDFYAGQFDLFPELETEAALEKSPLPRRVPFPAFEREALSPAESGKLSLDDSWHYDDRCMHPNEQFFGYAPEEWEEKISFEASEFRYAPRAGLPFGAVSEMEYRIFDAGRTLSGFLDLEAEAEQDSELFVLWDEVDWKEQGKNLPGLNVCFYRNSCCQVVKYALKKGKFHLQNFEPMTGRYFVLALKKGKIRLAPPSFVRYENPDVSALKFRCSDPRLEAVVEAARHTLAQNAADILTDCPSRERAGWLCDGFFSARAEKLFTGKNLVERNYLENYGLAPQDPDLPEGMIPMCYPADNPDHIYIPNWSLWFILELCDHVRRTGDYAMADLCRPKVEALEAFFRPCENEFGLLEDLGNWVFVEWSKANEYTGGVNFPSNMCYAQVLEEAGQLYGRPAWVERGRKLKETIRRMAFDGEFFVDQALRQEGKLVNTRNRTETCQYYALFFGVADRERDPDFYRTVLEEFGPNRDDKVVHPDVARSNAFIGNYLRLDYFMKAGERARMASECIDYFYKMALRTGTLWENDQVYGSLNHGFASLAANFVLECVTGFVEEIGGEIVRVPPVLDCDFEAEIPLSDGSLRLARKGSSRFEDRIRNVQK